MSENELPAVPTKIRLAQQPQIHQRILDSDRRAAIERAELSRPRASVALHEFCALLCRQRLAGVLIWRAVVGA